MTADKGLAAVRAVTEMTRSPGIGIQAVDKTMISMENDFFADSYQHAAPPFSV